MEKNAYDIRLLQIRNNLKFFAVEYNQKCDYLNIITKERRQNGKISVYDLLLYYNIRIAFHSKYMQ